MNKFKENMVIDKHEYYLNINVRYLFVTFVYKTDQTFCLQKTSFSEIRVFHFEVKTIIHFVLFKYRFF